MSTRTEATILSPAALQLLEFVAEFLSVELMPAQTDPKLKYRIRVAASLLRSARRELEQEGPFPMDVAAQRALVAQLNDGQRALTDSEVYEMSVRLVEAKLTIVTGGE